MRRSKKKKHSTVSTVKQSIDAIEGKDDDKQVVAVLERDPALTLEDNTSSAEILVLQKNNDDEKTKKSSKSKR